MISVTLFFLLLSIVTPLHAGCPPFCGGGGDPHLRGANGVRFDFNGRPDGVYNLISAPTFQINMKLAADGPTARFMTEIDVLFHDITMHFGTHRHNSSFIEELNAKLNPLGAKAVATAHKTTLDICPGLTVSITQMHTGKPALSHADGKPFNYLDVSFTTPGCHDAFGGVLGQTFQCKYAFGEKFKFHHDMEESFRVPSLSTRSHEFLPDADPCADINFDGDLMQALFTHPNVQDAREGHRE